MQPQSRSRPVVTNQTGVHEDLLRVLRRHRESPYRKPIARHTEAAFRQAYERIREFPGPLILDSGCGTGRSTVRLAQEHPDALVLGIDKSRARLQKNRYFEKETLENLLLLRAEIFDFWRLCARHEIRFDRHYILYPNPWPKKRHLKRRLHGHPAFFDLLKISRRIEVRSNWRLYLEEFAVAVRFAAGRECRVEKIPPDADPLTPFEAKYQKSGHELYRLQVEL